MLASRGGNRSSPAPSHGARVGKRPRSTISGLCDGEFQKSTAVLPRKEYETESPGILVFVGPTSSVQASPDPERLSNLSRSGFAASILGSAREDTVPFRSRRRILAQLGVAGLFSTSAIASAVKASGLGAGLSLGAAGAGAIAGAVALVAGTSFFEPTPAPLDAPSSNKTTAVARVVKEAPAVATAEPADPSEPTATAPAPARPAVRPTDSLSAELTAIEEARRALGEKNHGEALRLLDAYRKRFPRPRLGTEATVLRIETLVGMGDRAAAVATGKAFLARNADGPYARRVRSLIGEPASP